MDAQETSDQDQRTARKRKNSRRGRSAVGLSPRDLPDSTLDAIHRLAKSSCSSARAMYKRFGLAALGVNPGTFDKYVSRLRRSPLPDAAGKRTPSRTRAIAHAVLLQLQHSHSDPVIDDILTEILKLRFRQSHRGDEE